MKLSLHLLNAMGFVLVGTALTGCTTLLNMEDDTPPPPTPREVRQLTIPKDLAGNRPERVPLTPEALNAQKVFTPPAPAALMAPAVPVPAPPEPVKEPEPKVNSMLFAPYLPSVKEGTAPNKWQKQPVYDFPWIPGAEPTRVNEETVVGAGEQMLGRLYAKISFDHKPEPVAVPAPVVETKTAAKEAGPAGKDNKKNRKGRVTDAELNAPLSPITTTDTKKDAAAKPAKVVCESVTCLDAARDALVEDARLKGWEMLLNRRVSMHQSFQFARFGRVIWIELNLTAPKELVIEYSLMPEQNSLSKK